MQRSIIAIGLCLLGVLAVAAIAPAAGQQPAALDQAVQQDDGDFPRAEAGLDQTVERNTSVLLDASQSFSPDGELVDYAWHITGPDGASLTPTCDSGDCRLARFRASELGQYEVMVAVEDDDGQRETDTLYVQTVPAGGFGVNLTGPNATATDANLTATVAPGDAEVQNITWYQGDRELGNRSLPDLGGVFNRSTYVVPGAQYRVEVNDTWGQTVSDTWTAPGGGTWVPPTGSLPDDYPRIAGPVLVTGAPDRTDDGFWYYDSARYTIRTSERGTVSNGMWTLFGNDGTPDTYNADGTQLSPPLSPGPNLVVADLEIERRIQDLKYQEAPNGSEMRYLINQTSEETTVRRRVLVDPAPQISDFTIRRIGGRLSVNFKGEDRYNPPEEVRVTVGQTTLLKRTPSGTRFNVGTSVRIPADEYGTQPVVLRVVDGRGQMATRSTSITLPPPAPEDVPGDPVDYLPSDQSDQGGTSPPATG